jgi:hypothetical protein
MAADTKGLLVYIPGTSFTMRTLNAVVSTLIFVSVSERVAWSTGKLCAWICMTSKASATRGPKQSPAPTPAALSQPAGSNYTAVPTSSVDGHLAAANAKLSALPLVTPSRGKFTQLVVDDLRIRTALILVGLWVVNLLYPGDAPPEGHLLPTH